MEVVKILVEMRNTNRYANIIKDEGFYSSPEYFQAYSMYRKSKSGDMDALQMFVDSIGDSAANALKYAFGLPLEKSLQKMVDEEVKAAAIATGGTWSK